MNYSIANIRYEEARAGMLKAKPLLLNAFKRDNNQLWLRLRKANLLTALDWRKLKQLTKLWA